MAGATVVEEQQRRQKKSDKLVRKEGRRCRCRSRSPGDDIKLSTARRPPIRPATGRPLRYSFRPHRESWPTTTSRLDAPPSDGRTTRIQHRILAWICSTNGRVSHDSSFGPQGQRRGWGTPSLLANESSAADLAKEAQDRRLHRSTPPLRQRQNDYRTWSAGRLRWIYDYKPKMVEQYDKDCQLDSPRPTTHHDDLGRERFRRA